MLCESIGDKSTRCGRHRLYTVAVARITGEVFFLWSCVFFLPNGDTNKGAWVLIIALTILILLRVDSVIEFTCRACGPRRQHPGCFDWTVSLLYLTGLVTYLVGSVFYVDAVAMFKSGEILFTVGTVFFVLGGCVDSCRAAFESGTKSWTLATFDCLTAISYAIGAAFRLCGRFVYFMLILDPGADIVKLTWTMGIQCLIGSSLFVIGSVFNFVLVLVSISTDTGNDRRKKQRKQDAAPADDELSSTSFSRSTGAPRPVTSFIDEERVVWNHEFQVPAPARSPATSIGSMFAFIDELYDPAASTRKSKRHSRPTPIKDLPRIQTVAL